MPASLRIEIFPSDMQRCVDFYTQVLRFEVLRNEGTYAYLQRDAIFITAIAGVPPHVPGQSIDETSRKPPCGVKIVIEVDDVDGERDRIVESLKATGGGLEEDLVDRPWGFRDFGLCDPDGYYLRLTSHRQMQKSGD